MTNSAPTSVLVTGASSGIGAACALHLSRVGYRVIPTVRRREDGEALQKNAWGELNPIVMDVTDPDSIASAGERVRRICRDEGLGALINNAGITVTEPLEFVDLDELREQFRVNVTGHVAVTQAVLPQLRQAQGRILFSGSVAGLNAFPMFGPYNASKFALRAVADAFRMELAGSGVAVTLIEPGAVRSAIWEKALGSADQRIDAMPDEGRARYAPFIEGAIRAAQRAESHARPAEDVARRVERILNARRPRARYGMGAQYWASRFATALPTRLADAVIVSLFRRR